MSTEDLNKTNVIVQTEGEQYGEQIHTQISNSDLTNGIISVWNIDYQGRPTSWRIHNERQQISSTHYTIQLIQIPDDTQNMVIYVEDPITGDYRELYQVYNYDELVRPDTYYVHYANGIVKFNQELSGLNIVASYYGRGVMYLSDARVFHNRGGAVVDTLDNILNRAEDGLKLVEEAGGLANALIEIEEKTEQGKVVIGQIEDTIHSAQMFGCMVDFTKQSFVLKAEKDADGIFRVSSKEMASVYSQLVAYKGGEPMVGLEIVTEDANDKDVNGNRNVYQNNCSISFKNNVLSLNSILDPKSGRAMARVRIDIPKSQLYVQGDASGVLSIYKDFEFAIMMDGEDLYNLELSTPIYAFKGNYDGFIYETQQVEIDFTLTKANTSIAITELTYQSSSNSKLVIEKLSNSKVRITANADNDKDKPTIPSNGIIVFNASGGGSSVTKNFVYSVVREGKSAKMLFLTGEQVFMYDNPDCVGYPNKTALSLKSVVQNYEGQLRVRWFFLNSNGNPVQLINGTNAIISSDTLECQIQCWDFNEEGTPIPDQELNPWQGRRSATIRAIADNETYDEITIYKMGTGASGKDSFNVILTNETTSLTLDNTMTVIDNISNAYTDILCYYGNKKLDPSLVQFNIAELHECAIKYNNVFIADNGEARVQLSKIVEDPNEIEASASCLSLEDGDCFEFEGADDFDFDSDHTDDFELESDTTYGVVTNDTSYVTFDVTYEGVTVRKTFTISKSIQGANGSTGDKGDSLILDVTGGTRTITYTQVNTKPRPETSATFYVKLFNNGVEVDNDLVAYTWKANGHMSGSGYGSYFTPKILPSMDESIGTNEVIVEATYKTTVNINGKPQTVYQTLHYYVPIVVTRDATGLDWVNEWEGTKTEIKDHAVFTPKIFAGTKDEQDRITGVAMGCDFINDGASVGLAGYQQDEVSFLLDTDGSLMVGNPFKNDGVGMYYSKGSLTINVTDLSISGSSVPSMGDVNDSLAEAIQGAKDEFNKSLDNVQQQIDEINTDIGESLGDGVLNGQEKAKVEAVLLSLKNEHDGVNKQIEKILMNPHLTNEVVISKINNALDDYNSKFTSLEISVNNILAVDTGKVPTSMISAFNTALGDFRTSTENIKQVIDEALVNINQQYSDEVIANAKNEIQTEVNDLSSALDGLETTMNGSFKSGLISQAKIKALLEHVEIINNELKDITAQYTNIMSSTNLSSSKKTKLTELKGVLDTANATLQASIEMSIPDYLFTEEEINTIKTNIANYNTALQNYNVYAQECNVDISLNIAQGVVDAITDEEVFNKVTNHGIKQGIFIDDGQLYINGQYVQAYNFKAIRKTDGATTFLIDSNGNVEITPSKLTITTQAETNIATKDYVDNSISSSVGYTVLLDNDSQTIPVDESYYPLSNMTYRVNITVYKGATETPFTIGSVTAKNGLTATVGSTYVDFSVSTTTKITTASNVITIPVIVNGTTYNKVFSWSVSAQGVGQNAKVCQIVSDSQLFTSTDGITYTPSTITLTPLFQYCAFSKWQYEIDGIRTDVVSGQNGLTIESDNRLTISNATSLLSGRQSVTFVLLSGDSNAYDVLTVAKISNGLKGEDGADGTDGVDGLTVLLTNEAQSFTTDYTGRVLTTQTYTTDILVYKGANAYSFTNGLTTTTTNGITIKKTSNDTVSISVSAGTTIPTNNGSFTIPIVVDGVTYNKVLNWSLNKIGEKGETGASGTSAKVCKIVADNQVFISTDKITYTPATITLKPSLQNVTFSKWQYVLNGETKDVVSGQQGLTIDSSNNLIISNTTSLLDISSTAIFKLISSDSNVYDTFTIAKISDGIDGKDGINGKDGKDGTSVTIKGSYTSEEWSNVQSSLIPNALNGDGYIVEGDLYVFDGSKFINVGQIKGDKGDPGTDGKSSYLHIKYSNDGATFTSNNGETVGNYIGTYVDYTEADSSVFSDYTWKRYVGTDGIDGANGLDALTILLTNESQSFVTDSSGKATSTQTYTTDILVYKGTSSYDFTNNLTTMTSNGITARKVSNSQVSFTVSSGTTIGLDSGTFTIPIVVDGVIYNKVFSWSCTKQGATGASGADAKYVIVAGEQVFKYINNFSGTPTPSQITLAAEAVGIDSPSYQWSYRVPGATTATNIVGATNSTYTLTHDNGIWGSHKQLTLRCTSSGRYDEVTLVKVSDGTNGTDGINGTNGKDGVSTYFYVRYSANANGSGMTPTPTSSSLYMGVCSTTSPTAPTNASSYQWSLIKGADGQDGTPGVNGEDGRTSYLHIKYSNDGGSTFTENNGENVGTWIGTYVDFTQADSNSTSSYTWKKFVGDDGIDGTDAYSVLLTNENHTFPADSTGNIANAITITTTAIGYKGATSMTPSIGTLPTVNGLTLSKSNNVVTIKANTGTNLASNGNFTIPVILDGKTFNKVFSWTKSNAGKDGTDGKGIKSIVEYYLATSASSGVTTSTNGWTTSVQSVTKTNKYLWNYVVTTFTDNSTSSTTPCIIGAYGETGTNGTNGTDGVSITGVTEYYLATSASSGVTTSTSGWTTTIQTPSASKKYLWNYEVISYSNGKTTTGTPRIIGNYAKDGTNGTNGTNGANALALDLTASSYVMRSTDGGNTFSPSTITVTANCQNTSPKTWYISSDGGNSFSTIGTTGDTSLTLDLSSFTSRNTETLVIKCVSLSESVYDTVTIQKLTDVTDIKIGNRNLAQKTSDEWQTWTTFSNKENECILPYNILLKDFEVGDVINFHFRLKFENVTKGTQNTSGKIIMQTSGDVTGGEASGNTSKEIEIPTSVTSEITVEHSAMMTEKILENNMWFMDFKCNYIASGAISIRCLMVVNGKLPTAWFPAPEDMIDLIDNTVELFYERNNEVLQLVNRVTSDDYVSESERADFKLIYSQITSQHNSLISMIEKMEATQLEGYLDLLNNAYTSASDALYEIVEGNASEGASNARYVLTNFYDVYNQALYALSSYTKDELTHITAKLEQHDSSITMSVIKADQALNATTEVGKHMKFSDDWLELYGTINGESSQFKTRLSDQELAFYDTGSKVASISNQKLNITDAEVNRNLRIGQIEITPSAKGGVVFKFIK